MLNKIIIQGRMTRDIELRHTQSGTAVGNFSVAVERDLKDKQTGERGVDFIDVVAWGGTADLVAKWMGKGRMVIVEGRLQMRDWTDKDGNKRRSAEVVANSVYFGDSRNTDTHTDTATDAYAAPAPTSYAAPAQTDAYQELKGEDGELPF